MTRQNAAPAAAPAPQRTERSSRPERSERPSAGAASGVTQAANNRDARSAAARAMDEFTTDPSSAAGK
jgi:hypothetical protein